jgi:hypothetical protein
MARRGPRYVVLSPDDDFVWNPDLQCYVFKTIKSAREAITEELDEPVSEDLDTGELDTKRTDGYNEGHYRIFKEI